MLLVKAHKGMRFQIPGSQQVELHGGAAASGTLR